MSRVALTFIFPTASNYSLSAIPFSLSKSCFFFVDVFMFLKCSSLFKFLFLWKNFFLKFLKEIKFIFWGKFSFLGYIAFVSLQFIVTFVYLGL